MTRVERHEQRMRALQEERRQNYEASTARLVADLLQSERDAAVLSLLSKASRGVWRFCATCHSSTIIVLGSAGDSDGAWNDALGHLDCPVCGGEAVFVPEPVHLLADSELEAL